MPSQTEAPNTSWPPDRTATSSPCSRAKTTARTTSSAAAQRTIICGYLSVVGLTLASLRLESYSESAGTIKRPFKPFRSPSRSEGPVPICALRKGKKGIEIDPTAPASTLRRVNRAREMPRWLESGFLNEQNATSPNTVQRMKGYQFRSGQPGATAVRPPGALLPGTPLEILLRPSLFKHVPHEVSRPAASLPKFSKN
jgi:hypothetical protein